MKELRKRLALTGFTAAAMVLTGGIAIASFKPAAAAADTEPCRTVMEKGCEVDVEILTVYHTGRGHGEIATFVVHLRSGQIMQCVGRFNYGMHCTDITPAEDYR